MLGEKCIDFHKNRIKCFANMQRTRIKVFRRKAIEKRVRYREPGTNWFAKTCDFKMCREARDYYLTNDELSLDNNASLW